jgi:hypothetical protein
MKRTRRVVVVYAPLLCVRIGRGRLSTSRGKEDGLIGPREVGSRLEVERLKFFLCFRRAILLDEYGTFAFTLFLAMQCGTV